MGKDERNVSSYLLIDSRITISLSIMHSKGVKICMEKIHLHIERKWRTKQLNVSGLSLWVSS